MSSPTVFDCSCVIPTHDRDDFLQEAIASVWRQTTQPSEVIIVDDLGSQKTAQLVESLSTGSVPIRYVDASALETKGAGSSRNLGAKVATSSYLAFLDDDDLWKPDFLEESRRILAAKEEPAMVVAWASFLSGDQEFDGQSLPLGLSPSDAFSRNPGLTGSNFVICRDAFISLGGFDTNLWVSNDRDFLVRFLDSGHAYGVVNKRLVLQRVHQSGQLTNRNERRALGIDAFVEKHRTRLTPNDLRFLNRELYSIRRICHRSRTIRIQMVLRQLSTYRPEELVRTVRKKLSKSSTTYK